MYGGNYRLVLSTTFLILNPNVYLQKKRKKYRTLISCSFWHFHFQTFDAIISKLCFCIYKPIKKCGSLVQRSLKLNGIPPNDGCCRQVVAIKLVDKKSFPKIKLLFCQSDWKGRGYKHTISVAILLLHIGGSKQRCWQNNVKQCCQNNVRTIWKTQNENSHQHYRSYSGAK